jgi:predicted transcriptional regulator
MGEHQAMGTDHRALFISVRPRFAELLLNGQKTVELRRVQPAVASGSLVLLYASSPVCALVGTASIGNIQVSAHDDIWCRHGARTGISRDEYDDYFEGADTAVAIILTSVLPLPRAVPLRELRQGRKWFRPPQSFRYLDRHQIASFGMPMPTQL